MSSDEGNHRRPLNALTVDLEDWYQGLTSTGRQIDRWPSFEDRVVANTRRLLGVLSEGRVRATFFVLGYVAERFPDLVRRVADTGHEIALHGYLHRQVNRLTRDEFRIDTERGRSAVEQACGQKAVGYRAAMFSINGASLWALEQLHEMGFQYDSSVFPTRNMLYGYPDAPRFAYHPLGHAHFTEFPLSTVRALGVNWPVAGGFYLRALPYRLFRWALERINRSGKPGIIYLHPWDIDPGQPRPSPTVRERFTHYYNLGGTEHKLVQLLQDFRFGTLRDLLDEPVKMATA
jgi:polysaccharide deacetylase family protein (PEP-CTERM system associated)